MSLTQYRRKRQFNRTPEPRGRTSRRRGRMFVVQKHAARRLHYDFRLELDGVLKSWAVPKGPSLDPNEKRLAVQVEDHPLEYGTFEGTIPQGEYGGGAVMLWDRGEWEPIEDAETGLRSGRLKFTLHGEKLHGTWILVRRGGRHGRTDDKQQWLLFKQRDEEARPAAAGDILDELPLSVASGRDLQAIADEEGTTSDHESTSSHSRFNGSARSAKASSKRRRSTSLEVHGARKQPLPNTAEVELATLTDAAPEGDAWLHEIKLDGYRMLCRIDSGQVDFLSRNQQNWTQRLHPLIGDVRTLPVQQALLDGEVVAMRPDGTTDFQALQNAFREGRPATLQYIVFDLLYLDGRSLQEAPLEERKQALAELLLQAKPGAAIRLSEHIVGTGPEFLRQACRMHLEGIISKRRDSPYHAGRGRDWLKIKCLHREEFVIGGYTEPSGSRAGFGALLLGAFDEQRKLHYAGKVGTGFDDASLRSLLALLEPLQQSDSPFVDMRQRKGPTRTAHWVRPEVVAQISYASRTREGRLRHASFQGLREDKPARDVREETAVSLNEVMQARPGKSAKGARRSASSQRGKSRRSSPSRSAKSASESRYDDREQELDGVRLTSPDKVLFPDQGVTKLSLAEYYHKAAEWILPHIANRPLSLVRCPEGHTKACFFQKHPGAATPEVLRRIPVREKNKTEEYVVVDDVAGLVSLAQIGALELHAWGSRADELEKPDRMVFDLDPDPEVEWKRVVDSARQVRDFLGELGLESFLKTTGGKGLHIVVPIDRRHDWDDVKAFSKRVASAIATADPSTYTATLSKAARAGRIFIDYLRNGRGATSVAPYSPRARSGAPVSTPLAWRELSPRMRSDRFHLDNIFRRLS